MSSTKSAFEWKFHRIGGLDQVTLRTPEELRHLDELDPKLWVVLSCPTNDLQFDQRTLQLLDTDGDGRIRVQELLAAVSWLAARLKDPGFIADRPASLPLAQIREDRDDSRLLKAARRVLSGAGRGQDDSVTQEVATAAVNTASKAEFNGDGVIAPRPDLDPEVGQFISDVSACLGTVPEAGGEQGVNLDLAQRFMAEVNALLEWERALASQSAALSLGAGTSQAFAAYQAVTDKLDDYFLRCDLASFDMAATSALNASPDALEQLASRNLSEEENAIARLTLARIEAGKPLSLDSGLNPAWAERIAAFRDQAAKPLLGDVNVLSHEDWKRLKSLFTPYAAVASAKPATSVEKLGPERLAVLSDGKVMILFEQLVQRDLAAADDIQAMQDLERLTLYTLHLHRLLMNFVSFADFYSLHLPTTFQIGRLYVDGRSCNVCVRVQDVEKHAELARLSRLCLVYCECVRKERPGKITIAAAVTAGNSDLLIPGRHGVFVDNGGEEWDATLLKLVDNPISIRTAVLSPYRRIGRAVTAQIQKFTAAKDDSIVSNASKSLEDMAKPGDAKSFDLGKSMGIFAAVGLALGAIGTALATIASSLLSLDWWQIPLVFVGLFLLISGPSAFLAWLNLRKRTLGPVLDASGWAVNSQIPINLMMGRFLTGSAALPPNADRSLNDPFQKPSKWKQRLAVLLVLVLAAALAGGVWWAREHWEQPAPRDKPATTQAITH